MESSQIGRALSLDQAAAVTGARPEKGQELRGDGVAPTLATA